MENSEKMLNGNIVVKIIICGFVIAWLYSISLSQEIRSLDRQIKYSNKRIGALQAEISELRYQK